MRKIPKFSPNFVVRKLFGKAQFPLRPNPCGNCALPQNFHTRKLCENFGILRSGNIFSWNQSFQFFRKYFDSGNVTYSTGQEALGAYSEPCQTSNLSSPDCTREDKLIFENNN